MVVYIKVHCILSIIIVFYLWPRHFLSGCCGGQQFINIIYLVSVIKYEILDIILIHIHTKYALLWPLYTFSIRMVW